MNVLLKRELKRGLGHLIKHYDPCRAIEIFKDATLLTDSLEETKQIQKAIGEADVGSPEKAEIIIEHLMSEKNPALDPTNSERSDRAKLALEAFRQGEEPDEGDFSDLLCNLMHLAHRDGINFDNELERARSHYQHETHETKR